VAEGLFWLSLVRSRSRRRRHALAWVDDRPKTLEKGPENREKREAGCVCGVGIAGEVASS
jgi:hypothetical protein